MTPGSITTGPTGGGRGLLLYKDRIGSRDWPSKLHDTETSVIRWNSWCMYS